MSETVTVSIPLDGSVPPCAECGSITVDLNGGTAPCCNFGACSIADQRRGRIKREKHARDCPRESWCRLPAEHEGECLDRIDLGVAL